MVNIVVDDDDDDGDEMDTDKMKVVDNRHHLVHMVVDRSSELDNSILGPFLFELYVHFNIVSIYNVFLDIFDLCLRNKNPASKFFFHEESTIFYIFS